MQFYEKAIEVDGGQEVYSHRGNTAIYSRYQNKNARFECEVKEKMYQLTFLITYIPNSQRPLSC